MLLTSLNTTNEADAGSYDVSLKLVSTILGENLEKQYDFIIKIVTSEIQQEDSKDDKIDAQTIEIDANII